MPAALLRGGPGVVSLLDSVNPRTCRGVRNPVTPSPSFWPGVA